MDKSAVDISGFLRDEMKIENAELVRKLKRMAGLRTASKGTRLLEMGERPTHLHFLWSGICRGYLEDENGQDTTDCFAMERGDVLWG